MNAQQRREMIMTLLEQAKDPIKGTHLADILSVSRQVIVQDIAILRAEGRTIAATPQGYLLPGQYAASVNRRTFAVKHAAEEIEKELTAIVDQGGKIIDVRVEHPVYGEIQGNLMLTSRRDIQQFLESMQETKAEPLSTLTEGLHLHTVEAKDKETLDFIEQQLELLGFLVSRE